MSSQWEVVTKKKDKNSKPVPQKVISKDNGKKKNAVNEPKVEDVLPQSQIKSLFSKNKETPKQEKNKKVDNQVKKPQKKVEKQPEPPKPKPPKSIESALNSKIRNRMASKKSVSFPFKTLIVLSLLLTGLLILYDVKQQGTWAKSKTLKGLQDSGVYEYLNKASNRAKEGTFWIHQRVNEKFPGYSEKIIEIVGPYVQLIRDLSLVCWNVLNNIKDLIVEKYPDVFKSIDSYAPGLMEQSSKTVYNVWSSSVLYFNRSVDYLKREVFVGQLAPENVHRVVMDALNTTQQKASEYYHWLYEKVQTTIK